MSSKSVSLDQKLIDDITHQLTLRVDALSSEAQDLKEKHRRDGIGGDDLAEAEEAALKAREVRDQFRAATDQ